MNNLLDFEAASAKAELDELDRELAILKEGPFGPNSEFIQSFPANEREELLKALEEEGVMSSGTANYADLISDEDLEELVREDEGIEQPTQDPSSLKVTLGIPVKDKIYVKQFNAALDTAQQKEDQKTYFALWRWYLRCQQHVPNFALIIPEDVWHFLWKSQTTMYYRPKHIRMLGKDMLKADVSLEGKEWIEYIDALHATGDLAAAAEAWEAQRSQLGAQEEFAELFWLTGVRLYVDLGKPHKAQRLAFECYEHTTIMNADVLVMVISAWAKSQHASAADKTWYCYLELREKLETREDQKTILEILGKISSILLEANRVDLALAVFKDMFMLTAKSPQDSLGIFRELSKSTASDVHAPTEDLVSQIGLSVLANFPRKFANKYFFAAWIKWLLGAGRPDDAAMVVELMYERGIKPDAGPLNGLIAAWIRQGSPDDRQKAERTAWAMIDARVEMVQRRFPQGKAAKYRKSPAAAERMRPTFFKRGAPAATVETFSILLQYYTRRSDLTNAAQVTDVMVGPADLKPNSFIMNHWLYASLRSGNMAEVWAKYSSLKLSIAPDLETFAALWDTAKAAYSLPRRIEFPAARTVFAEMQQWFSGLDAKKRASTLEVTSPELYEQIIRCFCLSFDPYGTLCALHGLQQSFGMLPHEDVSRLIVMQVARAYASDFVPISARTGSLRLKKNLQYQSAVKTLTEMVVAISEQMVQRGDFDAEAVEQVESPQAQELRLRALSAFFRLVIEKRMKSVSPQEVTRQILEVAEEMKTSVPQEVLERGGWGDIEM